MTSNGGRGDEFRLVNHVKEEYEGDVNVIVGNEPGSRRYDELQIGKSDGNLKGGGDLYAQWDAISQAPQPHQQPQGSLVQWEKFLHVGSIKVMLVETDNSTRHIVTALLHICNYEVIEAANGFQAWKILEDLSNHIDIVLTEVLMPSLSGIGLLCKIMSHKTRKNIPVIMMSSHDSMGLVFKCLSKGATDFLLKPIRKNELKNLWQHVWRRCHSSSGSGGESGTNAQKYVNSKRSDDSISIIGDGTGSTPDGSDDGSGTQSSWTKQAVELESPQAASPCDEITEHPDSTCGIVIYSAESPAAWGFQDQEGQEDNVGKGKELAIGGSKDSKMQTALRNGREQNTPQDLNLTQNIDMCGPRLLNRESEALKEPENILDTNTKVMDDSRETVTEISLKRPRDDKTVQNGHTILKHSELSAFTRYNTTSNATRTRITTTNADIPPSDSLDPPRVHHIHHHHHVHHYHKVEPKQLPANHSDSGLKKLAASAPHCGSSSNVFGGTVDGNAGNYSLNRSVSGSRHGSYGQNGSSTAVNLEKKNVESGGGLTGKSGGGLTGKSGSGSENRIDQPKSAQREAALMKFREKRKDRCFQKKVRYHNRKKLADQRPRVRGQFVKQTGPESSSNAE